MTHAHTVEPFGDPFDDVMMGVVALMLALLLLVSAIGFAVVYYGDEVAKPSWNARTEPLPQQWPHF
jgi:hypothetical protein